MIWGGKIPLVLGWHPYLLIIWQQSSMPQVTFVHRLRGAPEASKASPSTAGDTSSSVEPKETQRLLALEVRHGSAKMGGRWGWQVEWDSRYLAFFALFLKAHGDKTCKVFFLGGTMDEFDGFSMTRVFFFKWFVGCDHLRHDIYWLQQLWDGLFLHPR